MSLTNQEKQERFRKKEILKKIANDIFNEWQLLSWKDFPKDSKDVRAKLDRIADLPSGWSDDDYQQALISFNTFKIELYSRNPYLLQNDIYSGRDSVKTQGMQDSPQTIREQNKAIWQAKKLVSHLNSAINLVGECASDSAAVVVELARNVGLSLLNERTVPKSNATTICLLVTNPVQKKPDWLINEIAKVLKEQLNEEAIKQLKEKL